MSHPTKKTQCPKCGYVFTRATDVTSGNPAAPAPGNYTVCIGCSEILCFTSDLDVRFLRTGELDGLSLELQMLLMHASSVVEWVRRARAGRKN
jgi:hypothetical protein